MPDIFGSNTPALPDNSDGTYYTMGTRFFSDVDGQITEIWYYAPTNSPGASVLPMTGQVWDDFTTLMLTNQAFSPLTLGTWNKLVLSPAISIVANKEYTVSVVTNRYVATSHFFDDPVVNGHITAPALAGRFTDLGTGGSPLPQYPNGQFNGGAYFIDLTFAPAGAGGLVVSVWNGTTEVPATSVKFWDGTSETSATVESVV
jgi:hypothetical protein